ncbi:hypothetical protein [Ferroacidibacillus organovorans]|uniref:Uncharacterized protein n=1 Tax=Ferroacidibacillus organovorans TaxID=1765683 RepID=A0A101XTP2_9BACL|nr:hypothetical protein [Ferroacidibacillus organovorans]KUO97358.1 hypothetical protein ATW55_05655 [Ferroacidibacillus organovorans]
MILTQDRAILAVLALGLVFFLQMKQRRAADTYMARIRERQRMRDEALQGRDREANASDVDLFEKEPKQGDVKPEDLERSASSLDTEVEGAHADGVLEGMADEETDRAAQHRQSAPPSS